jgi:hypothetical protein
MTRAYLVVVHRASPGLSIRPDTGTSVTLPEHPPPPAAAGGGFSVAVDENANLVMRDNLSGGKSGGALSYRARPHRNIAYTGVKAALSASSALLGFRSAMTQNAGLAR